MSAVVGGLRRLLAAPGLWVGAWLGLAALAFVSGRLVGVVVSAAVVPSSPGPVAPSEVVPSPCSVVVPTSCPVLVPSSSLVVVPSVAGSGIVVVVPGSPVLPPSSVPAAGGPTSRSTPRAMRPAR